MMTSTGIKDTVQHMLERKGLQSTQFFLLFSSYERNALTHAK